eukprot:1157087-Pelagomonas_calceolata.AAC.16
MPGLVRVLSTACTPPPEVAAKSSTKAVSRDPDTCLAPRLRRRARLEGEPAVAMAVAPKARATCEETSHNHKWIPQRQQTH